MIVINIFLQYACSFSVFVDIGLSRTRYTWRAITHFFQKVEIELVDSQPSKCFRLDPSWRTGALLISRTFSSRLSLNLHTLIRWLLLHLLCLPSLFPPHSLLSSLLKLTCLFPLQPQLPKPHPCYPQAATPVSGPSVTCAESTSFLVSPSLARLPDTHTKSDSTYIATHPISYTLSHATHAKNNTQDRHLTSYADALTTTNQPFADRILRNQWVPIFKNQDIQLMT